MKNNPKIIFALVLVFSGLFLFGKRTFAQSCSNGNFECGTPNELTNECENVNELILVGCTYGQNGCYSTFQDPCHLVGKCMVRLSGCSVQGGGGGGAACGPSSAGSCQGKNVGDACNNGTCKNAPKCSCQGNDSEQDLTGCNGTSIRCPLNENTTGCIQLNPLNFCGSRVNAHGNTVNFYDQCCGCVAGSPGTPSLIYPPDGENVDYTSVPLTWTLPGGWDTGCPINNNQYNIYVGTTNPPTTQVATQTSSDTSYDFTGNEAVETYYWQIGATNGSYETKSAVRSFNGNYDPWWQIMDADVLTNGNLTSGIPGNLVENFILDGAGGFPGVAIYGGTIADFSAGSGTGTLSSTGWLANSTSVSQKTFSYDYFAGLIPGDVIFNEITSTSIDESTLSSGTESRGFYWYRFDGTTGGTINQDLTISSDVNLGSRKVILLVKGANLNIEGNINLTDGAGSFVAIVGKNLGSKGNILLGPVVTDLEGLYFADSTFQSGSLGADLDAQLYVRGAVAAYEGLVLERDLPDDSTTPAEFFEYGLDQILLYPPSLGVRKIRWKEVAP